MNLRCIWRNHIGYSLSVAVTATLVATAMISPAPAQELMTLKGHTDVVTSVAFSPDGKRIVSASADKPVKIWDVPPLKPKP